MDKQSEFLSFPTIFIPFLLQYILQNQNSSHMQSQTAFYYIGQVLTGDLCFRHARRVLNLVHLVKDVIILTIVFRWSV